MFNPANILTLMRIALLPLFVFVFFGNFEHSLLYAGSILIISALTDFLDGYIARNFNYASRLGRFLDPLADKLTIITVFVSLTIRGLLPIWITIIILFRELFIFLGGLFLYYSHTEIISTSRIGKYATFLLYAVSLSLIFDLRIYLLLLFLALPLTLVSGTEYVFKAWKRYRPPHNKFFN